jgi:hypothetical protein
MLYPKKCLTGQPFCIYTPALLYSKTAYSFVSHLLRANNYWKNYNEGTVRKYFVAL